MRSVSGDVNPYALPIFVQVKGIGTLEISYEDLCKIGKEHNINIAGSFTPSSLKKLALKVTDHFFNTIGHNSTENDLHIHDHSTPSEPRWFASKMTDYFLETIGYSDSTEGAKRKLVSRAIYDALQGTREQPGPCAFIPSEISILSPINRPPEPVESCILF